MVPSTTPNPHLTEKPVCRSFSEGRTRVLFILGSMAGGGAERMVTHLLRHMDRDAFDARAGVLWRDGPYLADVTDAHLLVPRFLHGAIAYRDHPAWWRLLPSLALVPLQQYEIVRRFRPHIVVTATQSMNIAARFSLAASGRRHAAWIAREGNNTGAMIDSEGSGPFVHLQRAAVRGAYRSANMVVAISDGVKSGLIERFGLEPARVRTVHNAVDLDEVERRAAEPLAAPVAQPFIVAAGRLDRQKGFDVLIRAYANAVAQRGGLSLVILGEGPERGALEGLARELGLATSVHLPGFVANPWAYFSRALVFTCPSRWEGFGNVIIEAMASGAPVVASDCDFGPREIVRPGVSGLLVPPGDAAQLTAALTQLMDDDALRTRLAEGGRQRAKDFAVLPMVRAYEALFREASDRG